MIRSKARAARSKMLPVLAAVAMALVASFGTATSAAAGNVRTFEHPTIDGYPLDICPYDVGLDGLLRGRCGIPVANDYCRERGYAEALDAPVRHDAGPTLWLAGGVCPHSWCTTFLYITCAR